MMEYMDRFTKLTRFGDDYVATDMAKVRRFENGLKLSIRGKIVGLRLQDMDSMVGTALTIERERWMTHKALEMRVPVGRERRISLLRVWASRLRPLRKSIVWENSPLGSRVRVGQIL